MQTINVRDTRNKLSSLLDAVAAGEEFVILRRGQPAAKLVSAATPSVVRFPDRRELRSELPPMRATAAESIRALRDEERY